MLHFSHFIPRKNTRSKFNAEEHKQQNLYKTKRFGILEVYPKKLTKFYRVTFFKLIMYCNTKSRCTIYQGAVYNGAGRKGNGATEAYATGGRA